MDLVGEPAAVLPPRDTREQRLYLVRHGQSVWNAQGLVQGQTADVALSDLGRAQAQTLAQHLAGENIDLVVSSDLLRASQTADTIARAVGRDISFDRRLREQGYGRFEGRPVAELPAVTDTATGVGGGESFHDVVSRIGPLMEDLTSPTAPADRIVLVTHGDTIQAILAWLRGTPHERGADEIPENGSITRATLVGAHTTDIHTVTSIGRQAPHEHID